MLKLLMLMNNMVMKMDGEPAPAGGGSLLTGTPAPTPDPTPAPAPTPDPTPAPTGTPTWRDTLPEDLKADATLGKYKDVPALAAAHIALNKHLGSEKLVIPGKNATEDDWKQVFSKLGLPAEQKDYVIKAKEGTTIAPSFSEKFAEMAYKNGVLPKQAQALMDWFSDANATSEADYLEARTKAQGVELEALKTEMGAAFDPTLAKAARFISEFATPKEVEYLEKTGLGNDVNLIRLFMAAAKDRYTEDQVKGQESTGKVMLTPADSLKAARDIVANKDNPTHAAYHDASHPNHKAALAEVQELFQQASPRTATKA